MHLPIFRHLFFYFLLSGLFFVETLRAQTQNDEIVERLAAFAKLAGDIRIFSPTDAVQQAHLNFGWSNIFVHGTRMAREVSDDRAFADSLVSILRPLEPSLLLTYKGDTVCAPPPRSNTDGLVVGTQHVGINFLHDDTPYFKSIRTNRRSLISDLYMETAPEYATIRFPKGIPDKSFQLGICYTSDESLSMSFVKGEDSIIEKVLPPGDSVFVLEGKLADGEDVLNISLENDNLPTLRLMVDSTITIAGEKHEISSLLAATQDNAIGQYELKVMGNDPPLYEQQNRIGDTLHLDLTDDMKAAFPLAVYADNEHTFPLADYPHNAYPYNKAAISNYRDSKLLDDMDIRLSNVIVIWKAFRAAYVYNPLTPEEEEELLKTTLSKVLEGGSVKDYYRVVWKMLATYKDAHIHLIVDGLAPQFSYSPPISVIEVKENYFVKRLHDNALEDVINKGDQILEIDGRPIAKVVKELSAYSSGSERNTAARILFDLLYGPQDSIAELKLQDVKTGKHKQLSLDRNFQHKGRYLTTSTLDRTDNRMLDADTYYFNLTTGPLTDTLLNFMKDPSKNIIFELRGYFSTEAYRSRIVNKLLSDTIVHDIYYRYHILSPDRKHFQPAPQTWAPEDEGPKANLYFLADATTISAPETTLDKVKYFNIGTIIGQPTAGANGSVNKLHLPGGVHVTFSGLKILRSDGSEHHLQGITPDHYVNYTLEDVIEGRDPMIEKAMEIIGQ